MEEEESKEGEEKKMMETTTKGEQKFGPPILTHLVAESTHPK